MWQTFISLCLTLSGKTAKRPAPRRRPAFHCPSCRPRLEALEDRCLLSAGALDPTFGSGAGYVSTAVPSSTDGAETVLLQPDGKIIDAGQAELTDKHNTLQGYDFGAVRYNADGSLDTTFGSGGIALASPPVSSGGFAVHAYWAALSPSDGKIVVEGWYPVQSGKKDRT